MLKEQIGKISPIQPTPLNHCKPIFGSIPMISVSNATGDPAAEQGLKEVQTTLPAHETIFMKVTLYKARIILFTTPTPSIRIREQHIHYNAVPAPYVTTPTESLRTSSQSSEQQLALPALPSSATVSMTTFHTHAINQSTSADNMVIPSEEVASAALIVSPGNVCWNATGHPFEDLVTSAHPFAKSTISRLH
uniref:Uncharacterized protein n=1 Tax=Romanomermis culicivorax TaxID=13658 RepID=A0A915KBW1_ROMCU